MVHDIQAQQHVKSVEQPPVEQEQPPRLSDEGLAARAPGVVETRPETPPVAAPPTPPRSGLAATIHRMPRGWRWALGLALAFLSGVAAATLGALTLAANSFVPMALFVTLIVVAMALALAASFVLSTWWATLLLTVTTAVGAGVTMWVAVLMSPPRTIMELSGMQAVLAGFTWFVMVWLLPLLVVLFLGNAIGWWRRVGTV